jgi:hypothetical protein
MAIMAEVAYNTQHCQNRVILDNTEYPVPEQVKKAHAQKAAKFSRVGSKTWLALAMMFTPRGSSAAQIERLNGQMFENKALALQREGKITLNRPKGKCPVTGKRGMTFYKAVVKKPE